ncbi:MAG: TetR/AcrR family transcriptional regulator [Polyangiales bacterium]
MSRARQFSEREALQRATGLFAVHGYQGTSLAMLLEATGLARQSLYNCFGDKRDLYLHALELVAEHYAALQARLRAAPTGRAALETYLDQLVHGCSHGGPGRYCLLASGLQEGIEDPLVRSRLSERWAVAHEVLREAVERGQKDGSVRNLGPSAALADLLLAVSSGMRVNAGAAFSPDRHRRTADLALSVLDRDDPPEQF